MAANTERIYQEYIELLYSMTGIAVSDNKQQVFWNKLRKLMLRTAIDSPEELLLMLQSGQDRLLTQEFINVMTTNTTEFFREKDHFDFLLNHSDQLLDWNPRILRNREVRVWSAACSTGQEPLTLAIVLKEIFSQDINVRILATDINLQVLKQAQGGVYSAAVMKGIPRHLLLKWFEKEGEMFRAKDDLLRLISYRHFNMQRPFPFKHGFDIIFCRNVMIYFDNQVQQELADKFSETLVSGGLFFLGHSESLFNKRHQLTQVGHSIYLKEAKGGD